MKLSIIIPAYNEEKRIASTLEAYNSYFSQKKNETDLDYELLVVVNGATDNTALVVREYQKNIPELLLIDIPQAGKGLAITVGFKDAVKRNNDLIGFNDADMSTSPEEFYELVNQINGFDGVIASRYMPGATVIPQRPKIKRWGSKLVYEPLIRTLFGLRYYDYQCGAKIFKKNVIQKIAPSLHVRQWAFDLELLYLCKKNNFRIKEVPTVWIDKAGSKLRMFRSGMRMLGTVLVLRWHYWFTR